MTDGELGVRQSGQQRLHLKTAVCRALVESACTMSGHALFTPKQSEMSAAGAVLSLRDRPRPVSS